MDIVSLGSLIGSFVLLVFAFFEEGGSPVALISTTSALIVFGGTVGVLGVSFPFSRLKKLPKLFGIAFKNRKEDRVEILNYFEELATLVRRDGLLSLEKKITGGEMNDPFIIAGLQMVVDGTDAENLKHTMETKISNMEDRHSQGYSIFKAAGGYAPTLGVVGTCMGLVNVLSDLTDPGALGEKVAAAFIATLYGIASANIIWLPTATKLEGMDADEVVTKYMILDGIMMLQNGSNPALIREHLEGYLDNANKEEKGGE